MKKILALLLSLMLLLPALSLGEAAVDTYTVEFDDFTLTVSAYDIIQKGVKEENQLLFMLYPNYDETASVHSNINAVWTAEDVSDLGGVSVETLGEVVVAQTAAGLAAQSIAVTNEQLLAASQDEETGSITLVFSMDADYSAMGVDLQTTLYMVQLYVPCGEKGSYVFSLGSDTLEGTDLLLDYLNNSLAFKE